MLGSRLDGSLFCRKSRKKESTVQDGQGEVERGGKQNLEFIAVRQGPLAEIAGICFFLFFFWLFPG